MADNLVIVESPAKAKTIKDFLGDNFTVKASFGHIRDLDEKKLSIDVKNDFAPQYVVLSGKKKLITELKEEARKAHTVWLASDEDREGEAIAWHLYNTLELTPDKAKRIAFHEITKSALQQAVQNPRELNMDLVMAQQARRVLDRLVGYELSPVLWKKVQKGLSAGRVQSVAVRLIVDREREINSFIPQKYFRVEAIFSPEGSNAGIKALLDKKFGSEEEARSFLEKCKNASFSISSIETKRGSKTPAAPFTTSMLQQEAARKLGFSVKQTMSVAQALYERGLITYMRTDSTNLSSLAINTAKQTICQMFGEKYSKVRNYKTKSKGAQEAHEAIRPTYISNQEIEGNLTEKKLYNLIWKRTIACQMADAIIDRTIVSISGSGLDSLFVAEGEQIQFDGFLKVYIEGKDDDFDEETAVLPALNNGQTMTRQEMIATEKFTQKPPRYSEASLVKKLDELEIGRPSTYAPTVTTILSRGYIMKGDKPGEERAYTRMILRGDNLTTSIEKEVVGAEKKKLFPENIGIVVTDYLEKHFPKVLDYEFTANLEEDFDKVASGKIKWNKMIGDFYSPFHKQVDQAVKDTDFSKTEREIGIDPESGKVLIARIGPYGPMVQKGTKDDPQKQFASMMKGQLIETITLEEAVKLFILPRRVGEYQGFPIDAAIGRFGPYLKWNGKFISLGKVSPYSVGEAEAITLIQDKEEKETNKFISQFEASGIQVINGRYGPYIKKGNDNYKIPKGTDATTLTEQACLDIIASTPATAPKKRFVKSKK